MASLLLDTHAVLWWLAEPQRLNKKACQAIANERNEVFVSAVSAWEIAVKRMLGKFKVQGDLEADVKKQGFTLLPLTFLHAEQAGSLPPHHGDPFDRMLIDQAQVEDLILVTRDRYILRYDVSTMLA